MTDPENSVRTEKIGLLGGTFDPVHYGHLAVAEQARNVLKLDTVWFIPAAQPPHKSFHADGSPISSFRHRFTMLERVVEHNDSFIVSDIEAKRSLPSYSIDTIQILRQSMGEQADFYFLVGADAFWEIDTWKSYKKLPRLVNFVIVTRPGCPPEKIKEVINREYPDYKYDKSQAVWSSSGTKGRLIILPMEPVSISSTKIRECVRQGEDISDMVPFPVKDYIEKQRLYQ